MKKNLVLAFVSVAFLLMVPMVTPVAGAVSDYIGVVDGDEFEYTYSLTNGSVNEEFVFTLSIISVVGNDLGADITMEYLSDNATAQTMLSGFYSGPITLKEGHDGS